MDTFDLAAFAYSQLGFGKGQRKKVIKDNSTTFSAMKRIGDVCIRIANHRTKLRTWIDNLDKTNFPKQCISIVCLCGDESLDDYPGDETLPDNFKFVCKQYVYDFTSFTKADLKSLKNDIDVTFKNKSYPNNTLPGGQKGKPTKLGEEPNNALNTVHSHIENSSYKYPHLPFNGRHYLRPLTRHLNESSQNNLSFLDNDGCKWDAVCCFNNGNHAAYIVEDDGCYLIYVKGRRGYFRSEYIFPEAFEALKKLPNPCTLD